MRIAGIDFDSNGIDIVLLEEEADRAEHLRIRLVGTDAFTRARTVRSAFPLAAWWRDEDVLAVGIEDPRGPHRSADAPIYRTQGAILACLPETLLVQEWKPQSWRKQLAISHIGKEAPAHFAYDHWTNRPALATQDADDAFCIAWATRMVLVREGALG